MSKENWNQCRNLEINGCEHIEILESCPLQFACNDDKLDETTKVSRIAADEIDVDILTIRPVFGDGADDDFGPPDGCVSLFIYSNKKCLGPPVRTETFPTWTYPGSPCYHDSSMGKDSIENQYCNMMTGNWHETVYVGSSHCHSPHWYHYGGKFNLTFMADKCSHGVSLKECMKGGCPADLEGVLLVDYATQGLA
jgi:hypothetical protein